MPRVTLALPEEVFSAGMDRTDFLLALAREKANAFVVDFDDLKRGLERGCCS